jgi:predicted lipid-binding transport protein (Tim44 family)
LQVLELIIFAGLAAIVLYQLYSVLGRRVGRQPEETPATEAAAGLVRPLDRPAEPGAEGVALSGLAAVRAKDPSFDVNKFLAGARQAYETIVKAFADSDRDALKPLLAPHVYDSFDRAIGQREAEGRTESIEFLHPPRADLEKADLEGYDTASVTVRFLAEFRSRSKGPEGEAVDDRRTAELWTFERHVKSKDPNWTLVQVDAAEA